MSTWISSCFVSFVQGRRRNKVLFNAKEKKEKDEEKGEKGKNH